MEKLWSPGAIGQIKILSNNFLNKYILDFEDEEKMNEF